MIDNYFEREAILCENGMAPAKAASYAKLLVNYEFATGEKKEVLRQRIREWQKFNEIKDGAFE